MTGPAVITRINPRVTSWTGGSGGGKDQITAEDVAHAMGSPHRGERAARIEWAVAMLLYAGGEEYRGEVYHWLQDHIIKNVQGWRGYKHGQCDALASIVLEEKAPNRRCTCCKGRKESPDERGHMMPCQQCDGKGWIKLTGLRKAGALGVDESTYYRTWAAREEMLLVALDEIDARVIARLQRIG